MPERSSSDYTPHKRRGVLLEFSAAIREGGVAERIAGAILELNSSRSSMAIFLLRGCADRSWSAERPAFPAVAGPAFSDQPPHDDDHVRERHPGIDYPPLTLRTPHQLLMCVVPRIRPLNHPTFSGL